jgi:hypothetical protein
MEDTLIRVHSEEEVLFWRRLILPEEEKGFFVPKWKGGYRWFRDPKILCLEHYRRPAPNDDRKVA